MVSNYEKAVVFDLESNGFLDQLDTIHCISLRTPDSEHTRLFPPDKVPHALEILDRAECLVGHNIQAFDIPAIQKVYPQFKPRGLIRDTLIMSRLQRVHQMLRHSLEAWGELLNFPKGDYDGGWERYSVDMGTYCVRDTDVTVAVFRSLLEESYPERAIQLEHDFANILDWQMHMGVPFNEEAACMLANELELDIGEIDGRIRNTIPAWESTFIPKVNNSRYGYVRGVPVIKRQEFNPSSRQQVTRYLTERYRWSPTEFTDKGNPRLSGQILRDLPYPEAEILADRFEAAKLLGMVLKGDQAWLKQQRGGRLYGFVNHNGAVTGRCTHSNPNLAQIPRVTSFKGGECRALFCAEPAHQLVGCDASGLELRNLAHYMAPYDGGKYARTILEGDIHTENQVAAGLPTRDNAKTFIYAHNYGAGDAKLGAITRPDASFDVKKASGRQLRAQFMSRLPALRTLIDKVQAVSKTKGYLKGLDGRKLWVRSEHRALNTLLQGAGAVIMKEATVLQWKEVIGDQLDWRSYMANGGERAYPALHVHDETQSMVPDSQVQEFKEIAVRAIRQAGENFNYKCPLDGEAKEGLTWRETH